jgi:hypothetical protein
MKIYIQEHNGQSISNKELEDWYLTHTKLKDMKYSEILHLLFPSMEQKRTYLKQFFDDKEPGEVHHLIAKLVLDGFIRFIITTNFDSLLEKALNNSGLEGRYSVISTNDQARHSDTWDKVDICRIYKLHGDIIQGRIRNSVTELKSLDKYMKKDFQEIIDRHGVIVLGYSGGEYDKGVMNCFERREFQRYPIYWQYRSTLNDQVRRIIKRQDGHLIQNDSASKFLKELFERINIAKTQSEKPNREIIEGDIRQLLIKNNPVEVVERIEIERKRFIERLRKSLEEVDPNNYKDLWDTYVALLREAETILIIGKYLVRHGLFRYWDEHLKMLPEIYALNKTQNRYGKDGLVNYLQHSIFTVLGAFTLASERFEFIKSLYQVNIMHEGRLLNILSWNPIAQFIEDKNRIENSRFTVPRFQYLLQMTQDGNFPYESDELEKWLKNFDLLTFLYTVKYTTATFFPHWYPCSMYYFEYTDPEILVFIKNVEEYRQRIATILFGSSPDELMDFLRRQATEVLNDLIRRSSGWGLSNPLSTLHSDE